MAELFCTHCGCAVDLHDENGCACDDNTGHPNTLDATDGEEYCKCARTRPEFDKYSGWSTNNTHMLNGSYAHEFAKDVFIRRLTS